MTEQQLVVKRRLVHWRPRWRGPDADADAPEVDGDADADVPAGGGGWGTGILDALDEFFVVVAIILAAILFVVFVVPALVLLLEVLLVLLLAGLGLVGRVLFRRPWTVEAVDPATDRVVHRWQVVGWRRAGRARDQLRGLLAFGGDLPPDGPYDPDRASVS